MLHSMIGKRRWALLALATAALALTASALAAGASSNDRISFKMIRAVGLEGDWLCAERRRGGDRSVEWAG